MNVVAGVEEEALKVMVEQLCDPGSLVAMSPSNRRYRTNPAETQVLSEIDQEESKCFSRAKRGHHLEQSYSLTLFSLLSPSLSEADASRDASGHHRRLTSGRGDVGLYR